MEQNTEEATDNNSTFEDELYWCQRHLEEKLIAKRVSPREAQSILKSLKLLSNPKTPFIKKRQVMRLTCGDYRQAMQKQVKEIENLIHDCELDHVENNSSGRVLRKAAASSNETESREPAFLFNFPQPEGGQDIFK
ncbi:UPF0488 protein CG14286-like [Argiope bruennichi]|uniref:UPF0488 protein CG14286 like protein n=1 Tax=Argiope bruennichi TaxID=94029 RepID=A0A8T0FR44_ARGBR|nr:UPF0488 protein CG14286-like [Argiope bruennichi]KAF8791183.1 UPF0488 protein CG14286 like protein [Argiope bruennichi]